MVPSQRWSAARFLSVALLAACAGDFDQLLQQGGAYPISDGTSGSTTDDPSPASTTASTADASTTIGEATSVSTATTDVGTESDGATSTTTDDGKALPVNVEVFLTPTSVDKVGEMQVAVWTSRPVATIDVFDGDVPLALGATPGSACSR
ncbi:hypothetical protein [Nannocystis radixulma]|uniref:Uncharacterized protein n=1 Tax=Nannocystis radixulma TaxID=2995305 RepID=A0ABT5BP80_9BACT|nr:hypothetical protein [Nannocystis radixulma]MDC0675975.1 hypothetical protein [Nannocystis radixulma]